MYLRHWVRRPSPLAHWHCQWQSDSRAESAESESESESADSSVPVVTEWSLALLLPVVAVCCAAVPLCQSPYCQCPLFNFFAASCQPSCHYWQWMPGTMGTGGELAP